MVNKVWAIMDIKFGPSPKYGDNIYTIRFVGIQDQEYYTTYINPKHRNYKLWMKYIGTPHKGYVLRGLRSKDSNPYIIDADYAPKVEITYDNIEELATELENLWQEQVLT